MGFYRGVGLKSFDKFKMFKSTLVYLGLKGVKGRLYPHILHNVLVCLFDFLNDF